MIFDRTLSDVKQADQIRAEKVQKGISLTDDDITVLERGTLTYNTLNRIEAKQAELAKTLYGMGYYILVNNKEWTENDIFNESEFDRIVENNVALRKAFFVYADTPMDAVALYRYDEINALERILYDLERMIEYVQSKYRRCGTFNCGG